MGNKDDKKKRRNKWRDIPEPFATNWCFVCGRATEKSVCERCWREIVEDDRRRSRKDKDNE